MSMPMEPALLNSRAMADAPNGYAPANVSCPSPLPVIRPADALSPQEKSWLNKSASTTTEAMITVLERANIPGLDVRNYLTGIANSGGTMPRMGIAVSGGGYRALLNGAGALSAFDNRTTGAVGTGQLGGILQASTYVSGLSGGSWVVGSLYTLNFTTVESIIDSTSGFLSTLWQFNETIFEGQ